VTWLSMSPQHPDAAWDTDVPDVLRMLEQPGCVLCRICEEAARTWVHWFGMENHNDPALLRTLGESAGFCPAHTRRLIAATSARVLRPSLKFALGGAIGRAEQTVAGHGERKPRRQKAQARCPLCRVTAEREQAAVGDLAASLERPQVAAAIRDRGALCYRHLCQLLPGLSPAQVVAAAGAVADRLATLPAGTPESRFMLAGYDPDAHGVCLRHAAEVAPDRDAGPVLSRLLTQLRQAQWELAEDARRQAWDRRHEPRGHEQDAWRRIPALIDGEVYLGTTA